MSRLLVVLLLAGCASPRAAKMSFEEAVGARAPSPGPANLDTALAKFTAAVRRARLETPLGAAMPRRQVQAWTALLDEAERFGAQRAGPSWTREAMRVRLQLEGELQTDARLFGDIPAAVSERVPRTLLALSRRIAARTAQPRARKVDPRAFTWPISPLVVSSPYGARLHPIAGELRFHAGTDLEAPLAHPVMAAESGTVVFSSWNGGHGKQIEVQHDARWATRYSHLEALWVKPGALVKKGQVIGLAGASGLATGPHLHFELRRDGDALDPESFLPAPTSSPPLFSSLP